MITDQLPITCIVILRAVFWLICMKHNFFAVSKQNNEKIGGKVFFWQVTSKLNEFVESWIDMISIWFSWCWKCKQKEHPYNRFKSEIDWTIIFSTKVNLFTLLIHRKIEKYFKNSNGYFQSEFFKKFFLLFFLNLLTLKRYYEGN